MFNQVTDILKQNVDMTVAGGKKIKFLNNAINNVKNDTITEIHQVLQHITDVDVHKDQHIHLISKRPLRCINKCNEPPSAGDIKQSLNIDIASQNITASIFNNIQKNMVTQESDTKTSFSDVNQTKLSIFAIMFIINIIVIYMILYVISFFIVKFIEAETGNEIAASKEFNFKLTENIPEHVVTVVLFIILIMVYKTIICLWRTKDSKIGMMECMF